MVADLILFNANIIPVGPVPENARLVAIRNNKILAVEENESLEKFRHPHTEVIDCKGKTLLPGFIDAHCHLQAFAEELVSLNLSPGSNIRSISQMISRIRRLSGNLPQGTWIRGKGYNEFYLTEKRHPTRRDLDKAAPHHPVKLTHRSGHAHVLNTRAMALAGISMETPEPRGALIDRDIETGEPTGLLFEMGHFLSKTIPPLDNDELELGIKRVDRELLSQGITSVLDASSHNDINRWNGFFRWKDKSLLTPRVNMLVGVENLKEVEGQDYSYPAEKNQLSLSGVKIILDETAGHLHPPQPLLNEMVLRAHRLGLQVGIHAIEEHAIRSAIDAIAYALKKYPVADHRHHIEHCSVCPPKLAERLASLSIMVVTQPSFIYYNGDRYLRTVPGGQLRHLYPIGRLIKKGVEVVGSSDFPVVQSNPMTGIYAAVTRKTETGEVVLPAERLTPLAAIRMFTIDAARVTFEDKVKGSLEPGKFADLVVLSRDPTQVPEEKIKNVEVETTIINGKIVWRKEDKITG